MFLSELRRIQITIRHFDTSTFGHLAISHFSLRNVEFKTSPHIAFSNLCMFAFPHHKKLGHVGEPSFSYLKKGNLFALFRLLCPSTECSVETWHLKIFRWDKGIEHFSLNITQHSYHFHQCKFAIRSFIHEIRHSKSHDRLHSKFPG
jgi:hypothetical protein